MPSKQELADQISDLRGKISHLDAQILEHGKRFYRAGELETQIMGEIDLVKAMCNAVKWDTAEPMPEPTLVEQPANGGPLIVGSAYAAWKIVKWCPWVGQKVATVEFKETGTLVCLGCGGNH